MSKVGTSDIKSEYNNEQDGYEKFSQIIIKEFDLLISEHKVLFTTDVGELFPIFLTNLKEEARQNYTCNSCEKFINRYGGLVAINKDGKMFPVFWNGSEIPEFFAKSVKAMNEYILNSNVNGVFFSEKEVLGEPTTGKWNHISFVLPKNMVYHSKLKNSSQEMAEKLEDFKMLKNAMSEYPIKYVEQALKLLKTESLYRSEKCLGLAEWLNDLHIKCLNEKNSKKRENLIWLAVGTCPPGFCHVKNSMIGTLLDDIAAGLSFDYISNRFAEKMHPLKYQRAQTDPSEENIEQAEKIIEKLGIQKSFARRFAKVEELETVWKPKYEKKENSKIGMFSHLIPKNKSKEIETPTITMTWRKFSETILPDAKSIEFLVGKEKNSFSAIVTASFPDSPPIYQWDCLEKRNQFSHYVYINGSLHKDWNLPTGYCKVTGVCYQPSMWYEENAHHGKSIFFILENAKDDRYKNSHFGNCVFTESLKSELREIRKTIEAYSKGETIEGYKESSACGIRLQYDSKWDCTLKVETSLGTTNYKLDRWD